MQQSSLEVDDLDHGHIDASGQSSPTDEVSTTAQPQIVLIRPTKGWRAVDVRELWRYRELMYFLTLRDIKARYKQTILGVAWAILQPLMTTGVFAGLFAILLGRGNEPTVPGVPYLISTFCAMLPWTLFAESLSRGGTSLVTAQPIITKVYFPRMILPLAGVLGGLVDFFIALVVLFVLMACYGVSPSIGVLTLPIFLAIAIVASLSISLWLAGLSAMYRDFQHVVPFIVRIGMWVSPVIYTTDRISQKLPEWAMVIYSLNPMVGVIEGFRWALLGTRDLPITALLVSATMCLALLIGALLFFRRIEGVVIDVV